MKTLTITEVNKNPNKLRAAVEEDGKARITWKEQKPNGKITLSILCTKEDNTK